MLFVNIVLLLFLLGFAAFFIVQFYNIIFRRFPVFISTRENALKAVVKELTMKEKAVLYEVGCGNACFLREVRKKYPHAELTGIEYSFLPYLIANILNIFSKSNLTILKKNFLKLNFEKADVIYCYLGNAMMEELEKKFRKECKKDALVISYQFPLPNTKNHKVLEIKDREKAYFYRF